MTLTRRTVLTGAAALGTSRTAAAQPVPWTSQGSVPRAAGAIHWAALGPPVGEPVVLLHKLGGWIADWRAMAPLLVGKRVIAIDLPGHGASTMVGAPPYVQTVPESAAMILAALDEMGIERFALAGNSLGGCIAIAIAATWPERVSRLALLSVSLTSALSRAQVAEGDAAVRAQFGPNWEPLPRPFAEMQRFGSIDPRINDEQNLSRAKAGVWVRPSERGVGLMGPGDWLPRVEAPTLLMFADRGLYTRWEEIGRSKLKRVEVARIAEAGSFIHQEKPRETAAALLPFLS